MSLNEWAVKIKRTVFDELSQGNEPGLGEFDCGALTEARTLGKPQMGATVFSPNAARFEFVFAGANSTVVLSVSVASPERIVFLPVPSWVIESIWQGDVDGSYHFESKAESLLAELREMTEPEQNADLFGSKAPIGRQ